MQAVLGGPPPGDVVSNEGNNVTTDSNNIIPVLIKSDVPDSSSGSGAMVSRNGWNSVVMMRFNPGKATPKKVQEVVVEEVPNNIPMEVQNEVTPIDSISTAVDSGSSKGTEVVQLDKLKSIFYKEVFTVLFSSEFADNIDCDLRAEYGGTTAVVWPLAKPS
jgi:hypothetical protein